MCPQRNAAVKYDQSPGGVWTPRKITFRPYQGRGLEEVALTDYRFLYGWLRKKYDGGELRHLTPIDLGGEDSFLTRMDRVQQALNHFKPTSMKCKRTGCKNTASQLVVKEYGNTTSEIVFDDNSGFYCDDRNCHPVVEGESGKWYKAVYPGFDMILKLVHRDSSDAYRDAIHDKFRRIAGWPEGQAVTAESACDFIYRLWAEYQKTVVPATTVPAPEAKPKKPAKDIQPTLF